jgi:hypothetical protein
VEDADLFLVVHKGEMDVRFAFKEVSEFCRRVYGGMKVRVEQRKMTFGEGNDAVVSGIMGCPSIDRRNKMSSVCPRTATGGDVRIARRVNTAVVEILRG